ncbi:unnamed protein product, partial [Trichogramma brassicae]
MSHSKQMTKCGDATEYCHRGAKGIAAKLGRRFRGPCKVSKVLGSNVYQLIGESGELVEKVTASDLKPCYGRSSTAESDERNSATANVTSVKSTTAAVSDERKSAATDVTSGELSATSNKNDGKIATKAKLDSALYTHTHERAQNRTLHTELSIRNISLTLNQQN